jgi:hypothetical protein
MVEIVIIKKFTTNNYSPCRIKIEPTVATSDDPRYWRHIRQSGFNTLHINAGNEITMIQD